MLSKDDPIIVFHIENLNIKIINGKDDRINIKKKFIDEKYKQRIKK